MISPSGMPIGTSIRPVLLILPVRAKIAVPGDFSGPMALNQSAPRSRIWGDMAYDLTLLTFDGFAQSPATAGNGGRGRGSPRLPSMEAINAVSSPQTNAPAPSFTFR